MKKDASPLGIYLNTGNLAESCLISTEKFETELERILPADLIPKISIENHSTPLAPSTHLKFLIELFRVYWKINKNSGSPSSEPPFLTDEKFSELSPKKLLLRYQAKGMHYLLLTKNSSVTQDNFVALPLALGFYSFVSNAAHCKLSLCLESTFLEYEADNLLPTLYKPHPLIDDANATPISLSNYTLTKCASMAYLFHPFLCDRPSKQLVLIFLDGMMRSFFWGLILFLISKLYILAD